MLRLAMSGSKRIRECLLVGDALKKIMYKQLPIRNSRDQRASYLKEKVEILRRVFCQ
tara:strand:+ start:299 stop:469 length:171 start_codon:yes stop_codon:yes gene_type:complete